MARTLRLKKSVIANMAGAELFDKKEVSSQACRYEFDGATMYATIPDWTPKGLPFSVEVSAVPLSDKTAYFWAQSGSGYRAFQTITSRDVGSIPEGGGQQTVPAAIDVGVMATVRNTFSASERILAVNEASVSGLPIDPTLQVVNHIAGRDGATTFHGPIWDLKLTDNSPIQDTNACVGDGNRYVQLENPIVIPPGNAWEVEWQGIRTAADVNYLNLLGNSTYANNVVIQLFGAGAAAGSSANRVTFADDDGAALAGVDVLADVAGGQHYTGTIRCDGVERIYSIDGVEKVRASYTPAGISFDRIGARVQGVNTLQADEALQNVIIRDLANNREWEYKLNEGSGTTAIDSGTEGNSGTWAPDVDWRLFESNSRYYRMDDKDATLVDDYHPDGSKDGLIINYNADNWTCPGAQPAVTGWFKGQDLGNNVVGVDLSQPGAEAQLPEVGGAQISVIGSLNQQLNPLTGFQVLGDPGQQAFKDVFIYEDDGKGKPNGFYNTAVKAVYNNGLWVWDSDTFQFQVGGRYFVYIRF